MNKCARFMAHHVMRLERTLLAMYRSSWKWLVILVCTIAEFKHLKDMDLREKRRESERLVKAALQSLIQHGCIVCYLVQPEVTRRNLSPEEFHMYTVDLPAIVNIIR